MYTAEVDTERTATGRGCPSRRIAGHLPTGMIDWPGRVSSTLFLSGCPLRCPYCHNPSLLPVSCDPGQWEGAISHLTVRRGWIDGVVVSGGEPTADPDIMALLETLAAKGHSVKLDTNGYSPAVLGDILDSGLVDYVALDVKTFPDRYHLLGPAEVGEAVMECIDLIRTSGIDHEFRTTVYPPVIGAAELPELAAHLRGGSLYAIQQFRPASTLDPQAAAVIPESPALLVQAAASCSHHIPTITRGV